MRNSQIVCFHLQECYFQFEFYFYQRKAFANIWTKFIGSGICTDTICHLLLRDNLVILKDTISILFNACHIVTYESNTSTIRNQINIHNMLLSTYFLPFFLSFIHSFWIEPLVENIPYYVLHWWCDCWQIPAMIFSHSFLFTFYTITIHW